MQQTCLLSPPLTSVQVPPAPSPDSTGTLIPSAPAPPPVPFRPGVPGPAFQRARARAGGRAAFSPTPLLDSRQSSSAFHSCLPCRCARTASLLPHSSSSISTGRLALPLFFTPSSHSSGKRPSFIRSREERRDGRRVFSVGCSIIILERATRDEGRRLQQAIALLLVERGDRLYVCVIDGIGGRVH